MKEITLEISELNLLVKELRAAKGLTREEFGERVGTQPQNIYNLETGRVKLGFNKLRKIAKEFGYEVVITLEEKRK
jgi:transcriptional regulator with XRE-family HTH domain